jgi:hypothetical protein
VNKRRFGLLFGGLVLGLFVAGIVWRATTPAEPSNEPSEERQTQSRLRGYYLCLKLPVLTEDERRRLVRAKLPREDFEWALRGCDEAQTR